MEVCTPAFVWGAEPFQLCLPQCHPQPAAVISLFRKRQQLQGELGNPSSTSGWHVTVQKWRAALGLCLDLQHPAEACDSGRETALPALLQLSRWSLPVPAASTSSWMVGWRAMGLLGGTCLTILPEWHICINAWVTVVNCCTQQTKSHRNPGAAEKTKQNTSLF